jgi:hypothetical protein
VIADWELIRADDDDVRLLRTFDGLRTQLAGQPLRLATRQASELS